MTFGAAPRPPLAVGDGQPGAPQVGGGQQGDAAPLSALGRHGDGGLGGADPSTFAS